MCVESHIQTKRQWKAHMKLRKQWSAALALLAAGITAAEATVTFVGNDLDTGPGWRTASAVKPSDIDADNIYGTAGYYLAAGLRAGYEGVWLTDNVLTGASNDDDINTLPGFITSFEFTDPAERGRSWGGSGGNFGTLDKVSPAHTGFTGAPILRRDATAGPLSLTLKRSNSPAFRLTLIIGSANEGGFNDASGQDITVDDGQESVTVSAPTPGNAAATTYQSWDIGAGSSDIVVNIVGLPEGSGVARLSGLAIDRNAVIAPTLTSQPESGTWLAGIPLTLSAQASGTAPLSYVWYKETKEIPGANTADLSFQALAVSDAATYSLVVANSAGSVTSNPVKITIESALPSKTLAYQKAIRESGALLSEYSFDAGDANDSLGAHHGTLSGIAAFGSGPSGGADKAIRLNGAGHVSLDVVSDFEFPSGDGAVEAWVQADWSAENPPPFNPCIAANRDGGPTRWSIHMLQNKQQLALWNGANVAVIAIPPAAVGWHHFASVFQAGNWIVYWDGVAVANASIGLGASSGRSTQIGSSSSASTTEGWVGSLDEVAFYNTALTPEEVAGHFEAFVVGDPPLLVVQPASITELVGASAQVTAAASGSKVTLQWLHNGSEVAGANSGTLAFDAIAESDAGFYQLVARNPVGSVTSRVAVVTVLKADVAAYRSAVLGDSSLRSLYTFDGGDGSDALAAYNGSLAGTATTGPGTGEASNQALLLDGSGHVALDAVPDFGFAEGSGSVEALVRADWPAGTPPPYNPCLAANRNGGPTRWSLHMMQNKKQIAFWNGATVGFISIPDAGEKWHHLVSVFDAGTWRIYWDGVLVGTTGTPLGSGADLTTQIGGSSAASSTEGWVGALDEVAFYVSALDENTVAAHYNAWVGPRLSLTQSGRQAVISWPQGAAGYELQSSDSLPGTAWERVAGVTDNSLTILPTSPARYYRLRKP